MLQSPTVHSVCMRSILRTSQVVWLALFLLIKLSEHSVLVFWCACEACRHSSVSISCSLPAGTTVDESQATHFPQLYLGLPLCVRVCACIYVLECVSTLCISPHCWGPGWLYKVLAPVTSLDEGCQHSCGCGFLVRTEQRKGLLGYCTIFLFLPKIRGQSYMQSSHQCYMNEKEKTSMENDVDHSMALLYWAIQMIFK